MFIAALFIIAKIWKQPEGPSVDERITQLWDIYTMEYYSAIKRKKFALATTQMDLENTTAIKKRQIPHDFTHIWNLMNKLN